MEKIILLCFCIFICQATGFLLGYLNKLDRDTRKISTFKFLQSKYGMFRVNTTTGQVDLITNKDNTKTIHKGKKFRSVPGSFDLVKNDENGYVLFDTYSGYYTILKEDSSKTLGWG